MLKIVVAGNIDYRECWDLQSALLKRKKEGVQDDFFLLVEHPHVYTLGKVARKEHLLFDESELAARNVTTYEIDRGGDITYHGPGQLVGYPILDLNHWYCDSHKYLRSLEQILIESAAKFGISGGRTEGLTGVWIGDRKIAAIGVKISSWITMHGFALNVCPDLSFFNGIIPCGITDKAVTSMQDELHRSISVSEVIPVVIDEFVKEFQIGEFEMSTMSELKSIVELKEITNE